jgi:hypothetical protein
VKASQRIPIKNPADSLPATEVAILREHLFEHMPVSDLCDKHKRHPTLFYRWQKVSLRTEPQPLKVGAGEFGRSGVHPLRDDCHPPIGRMGLAEAPEPGTRTTAIDPLEKIVDMTASADSVVGEPTYRRANHKSPFSGQKFISVR